jgi:hypothetical protein
MKRRDFIYKLGIAAIVSNAILESCKNKSTNFTIKENNGNTSSGHLLRNKFEKPLEYTTDKVDILIVGGGIAGLSTARKIATKKGLNAKLIELANDVGGNSLGDKNEISEYPWAAHYLPIPSLDMKELIAFLEEAKIITHFEKGLPYYDDAYLCFDNKERLFINGKWQNGIVPHFNIPENDKEEINSFLNLVHILRDKKDELGKYYFDIPLINSSQKNEYFKLNKITAKEWLIQNNYNSPYLHWYINYCTSDDFGTNVKDTSAWAMLHYFASRRGKAMNADYDDVLTWPEGNSFLVKELKKQINFPIYTNEVALNIEHTNGNSEIFHQNTRTKKWTKTICKNLVLNTPFHVVKKLLPIFDTIENKTQFNAYPWIVCNITLNRLIEKNGMPLSWDNVIYGHDSLGFIHSTHQTFSRKETTHVFTYYKALNNLSASEEKKILYKSTIEQLKNDILQELKMVYPNIEDGILHMEIKKIGHGMISPAPNFLFSKTLTNFSTAYKNIHFTHTDFCGISIFEEAFYKGIETANLILKA